MILYHLSTIYTPFIPFVPVPFKLLDSAIAPSLHLYLLSAIRPICDPTQHESPKTTGGCDNTTANRSQCDTATGSPPELVLTPWCNLQPTSPYLDPALLQPLETIPTSQPTTNPQRPTRTRTQRTPSAPQQSIKTSTNLQIYTPKAHGRCRETAAISPPPRPPHRDASTPPHPQRCRAKASACAR